VGLSFGRDSWVALMDARRVPPERNANDVAAEQLRELVCKALLLGCLFCFARRTVTQAFVALGLTDHD
jgi:hypothetical protein